MNQNTSFHNSLDYQNNYSTQTGQMLLKNGRKFNKSQQPSTFGGRYKFQNNFKAQQKQLTQQTPTSTENMHSQEEILILCKNHLNFLIESNTKIFKANCNKVNLNGQEGTNNEIFKQVGLISYLDVYLSGLKQKKPFLISCFYTYCKKEKQFYRFLQHLYFQNTLAVFNFLFEYIFYIWELYYPYRNHYKIVNCKDLSHILQRIALKIFDGQVKLRSNLALKGIESQQLYTLIDSLSKIIGSLMSTANLDVLMSQLNMNSFQNKEKQSSMSDLDQRISKKIKTIEQLS